MARDLCLLTAVCSVEYAAKEKVGVAPDSGGGACTMVLL